jgi:hypothetical protein
MGALGIILLTVGAVLTFAIEASVEGVDINAVGVIFMVMGAIAVILGVVRGSFGFRTRTERSVSSDGRHVIEEQQTNNV